MEPTPTTEQDELLQQYSLVRAREDRIARVLEDPAADAEVAMRVLVERARTVLAARRAAAALALLDSAAELGVLDPAAMVLRARAASIADDERAVVLWRDARDAATAAGDDDRRWRAIVELVKCGDEAQAALADAGAAASGWASYAAALDRYFRGDAQAALELARGALATSRDGDDVELEINALRTIATVHADLGELDLSIALLREVIEVADDFDDPRALKSTVLNLVYTLVEALRGGEAVEVAALFERLVDPRDAGRPRAMAFTARAMAATLVGELSAACSYMQQSLEVVPLEGGDVDEAFRASVLGECIAQRHGCTPATQRTLDLAARVLDEFGYESFIARLQVVRGAGVLAAGDVAPLTAALARVDHEHELMDTAFGVLQLARGARIVASLAQRDVARTIAAVARPAEPTPFVALAWREVDALAAGDRDELEAIAAQWREAGFEWFAALTTLAHARLALEASEVEAARTLALDAVRALTSCGADADLALARSVLAELDGTDADPAPLLQCSLFAGVAPAIVADLARHARRIEVRAGELVDDGLDDDAGLVVLESGLAFVVGRASADAPILDARVEGEAHVRDWHGAARADGRDQAALLAAGDLVAWVIPSPRLRRASVEDARLLGALLRLADGDAARSRELAEDLASADVRQRLARLLLRLERDHGRPSLRGDRLIDVPLTAAQLARMCGTQRQRVSTMIAAWRRDGVLDTWRRRIVVDDLEALRAAAGVTEPIGRTA